jgi:MFS family permease
LRSTAWASGFLALCVGQFLAHQTSLSFSSLIPILTTEWNLSASQAGIILGGFQLGTLVAYVAVGFLLDRMRSKPIMALSAALVGAGDLLFALAARDFVSGLALRVLVGILYGGLYLPALKQIAETIPPEHRGVATGVYISAIVMATAAPLYYVGALAPVVGWRAAIAGIGGLELLGALIMVWKIPNVAMPPMAGPANLRRYLGDVLKNRAARRVIAAYTGHNWELFGMWGWITPFMVASLGARGVARSDALAWGGLLAAAGVGVAGGIGAVAGGRLSDRLGRARAATLILAVSLLCSAVFGWLFAAPLALMIAVNLLYGLVSLADSPSYAATLMEVVPPRSLGGAFSLQMLTGWTATIVAPAAFGLILDLTRAAQAPPTAQWGWAFAAMAIGPAVGVVALAPLRARASSLRA